MHDYDFNNPGEEDLENTFGSTTLGASLAGSIPLLSISSNGTVNGGSFLSHSHGTGPTGTDSPKVNRSPTPELKQSSDVLKKISNDSTTPQKKRGSAIFGKMHKMFGKDEKGPDD